MARKNSDDKQKPATNKDIIVVGAHGCGKSTLIQSLARQQFVSHPAPRQRMEHTVELDGKSVARDWVDLCAIVPDKQDYQARYEAYSRCRAVVICYSIDDPDSLCEVITLWAPELQHFSPYLPVVLAALKCDVRTEPEHILKIERQGKKLVTASQGEQLADRINARMYVEVDCRKYKGVTKLGAIATRITLKPVNKPSNSCVVS